MGKKLSKKGKESTEKERKLFDKRKESTERMAMFNRRYFNNLRKNWEIKREDHLLPNAKSVFYFIDANLFEMDILKDPENVVDWHQVVIDEEFSESRIQESIAVLSWVYWQRLEGYETLDVSLSRERLVEDIGCIQQFYNAADGLILEYQRCFSVQLPIDIICVYGLYPHFHTAFRHFIMVPNQTRYEYIPAWISVAHEVAHIAIDEIENNYYPAWKETETIRKLKMKFGEIEYVGENGFEPERVREKLRKKLRKKLREGLIPLEVLEIIENSSKLIGEIDSKVKERDGTKEILLGLSEEVDLLCSTLKSADEPQSDLPSLCRSVFRSLDNVSGIMMTIGDLLGTAKIMDRDKQRINREIIKIEFKVFSLMEIFSKEELFLRLFRNLEDRDIDTFFSEWRKIKKRAIDIAETILRVFEGDTGFVYLHEPDPKNMRHVYISEHILSDIIATLIAGEFYLYSLAFYRFLPSAYPSEEGVIRKKQRLPMSLRLFICLETLKYSCWEEMEEAIDDIEELWIKLASNYEELEEREKEFQEYKKNKWNENCEKTADLVWNLIKSIAVEDSCLEKEYTNLLKAAEEDSEENKRKFDESYFNYMRHALGNALKEMLRNPDGFLIGMDTEREMDSERNCLKRLIMSVKENLIDCTELFTTVERYETIERIKGDLKNGILKFDEENCSKKGSDHGNCITPRNILSAYAQIYFEHILNPEKEKSEDYITAFNPTVMSMAWSQHALERFHDGRT